MARAFLLVTATIVLAAPRRASRALIWAPSRAREVRTTALAPWISSVRKYRAPPLDTRPAPGLRVDLTMVRYGPSTA